MDLVVLGKVDTTIQQMTARAIRLKTAAEASALSTATRQTTHHLSLLGAFVTELYQRGYTAGKLDLETLPRKRQMVDIREGNKQ